MTSPERTPSTPKARRGSPLEFADLAFVRSRLRQVLESRREERLASGSSSAKNTPEEQDRVLELETEQFEYCLGAARDSLRSLEGLARTLCARPRPPVPPTGNVTLVLTPAERAPLCWEIDRFLDAMRRAQNGLTPLIARTFTASKIQSFSELVDAIRAKPEKYSPEAAELVAEYWERSGRAIKGYRDISQHHAVVASDVRLFYGEGIPVLLHVLLPSNPHEKSLYKLSYGEPVVMAVPFCRDAFIDLVAFSLAMSRVLRVRLGPAATVTMRHTFKAPVHLNSLLGFHEPLPDDLDTFLWELREDAESNSGKYFEPLHPPEPA